MTDYRDYYERAADEFEIRLLALEPHDWATIVPSCSEWTVSDLVGHVVMMNRGVGGMLKDRAAPEVPADDVVGQWKVWRRFVESALADPALADTVITSMFGQNTFALLAGGLLVSDMMLHTWDLATATGQPDAFDPELVEHSFEVLSNFDDALRVTNGFGPKITPAPDAPLQTRWLNFAGRQG